MIDSRCLIGQRAILRAEKGIKEDNIKNG